MSFLDVYKKYQMGLLQMQMQIPEATGSFLKAKKSCQVSYVRLTWVAADDFLMKLSSWRMLVGVSWSGQAVNWNWRTSLTPAPPSFTFTFRCFSRNLLTV